MIRRAYIIGTVAMGLLITATAAPKVTRFVSSARTASHYFQDLQKSGDSLNPIERLVFSFILANTKPHGTAQNGAVVAPVETPMT
jgi:hypothetical protein